MNYGLDDDLALMIVVSECCGRATFLLLEDAVEVADVVEAATIANLCHTGVSIDKQTSCITQTDVDDVVADSLARPCAEETRESSWRHSGNVGKSLQANLLLEVLVDMLFDGTNSTAFGLVLHICKRFACQQMIVVLKREFVKDLEQREHPVEARLS